LLEKYIKQNLIEYEVSVFVGVPLLINKMYETIEKEIEKQGKTKLIKNAIKISNFLLKFHIDIRKKLFKQIVNALGGKMRLIVAGSRDGSLLLISTQDFIFSRVISTAPIIPKKVLITEAWGFIVSEGVEIDSGIMQHFINVCTIDGDLIRTEKIDFGVNCWNTWSENGVDYVCIGGDNKEIYIKFNDFVLLS